MTPRSFPKSAGLASIPAVCAIAALALAACSKQAQETAAAPKPAAPAAKEASPPPVAASPAAPAAKAATPGPALETVDQRVSYGVGYNVGGTIAKQADLTVDKQALLAGLEDGIEGAKTRIAGADIEAAFAAMQKRAVEKQLAATQDFFDRNRARPGVTVTPSGLQYEVLVHGSGTVKPKPTDTVTVNYEGRLLDGTLFDSSIKRGSPAQFPVSAVIHGWTEALQLMSVGDKWRLFIPASLAYGARGKGEIPPNSALIFDVELLGIK